MPGLQEFIHKLEEGEWVRPVKVVTALLAVVALTVWYDLHQFQNFHAPEAMEAAQLARNLARGKGFTTQCIRPVSLHLVEERQGVNGRLSRQPHPDLQNPPLYPLVLAGLMKALPFHYEMGPSFYRYQPEMIIAVFNQTLFFLGVWLMYRLAKRLFDPQVALLSAVALMGSDVLWSFSASGLSTMLLLLIMTGILWGLVLLERAGREDQRGPRWYAAWALAVGGLVGLGGLTRYSFAWMIIPVAAFCAAFLGTRRAMVCGLVIGSFVLVLSPWLVRNYQVSGTLFGVPGFALYQETLAFPGTLLERSLNPDLARIGLDEYPRKLLVGAGEIVQSHLPRLGASWVGAFFLVGLLLPFRDPGLGRLRLFVVFSLVVMTLVQALGRTHLSAEGAVITSENLLVLLAPAIFLFGVALFCQLLDQLGAEIPAARPVASLGFVVMACASMGFTLLPPRSVAVVPPYIPPWIQDAAKLLAERELMMSDMPWAVAWYGNRSCVWIPSDANKSFYRINDDQKGISALYLTGLTTDAHFVSQVVQGMDHQWARLATEVILHGNLPPGFPLQDAFRGYMPAQILLSDRARWKEKKR